MFQEERLNLIMKILKECRYATVDQLVEEVRYSPTSIRRDLAELEKRHLIKRSYGGAEILEKSYAPFVYRQHSMKKEKKAVAKKASELVNDGDTIFLDESSTVQYMGEYLADKKKIKVITGNLSLAQYFCEMGINTHIICGKVSEKPGTVTGPLVEKSLEFFNIDKAFFSTNGISEDGYCVTFTEFPVFKSFAIRRNCREMVLLNTSDKFHSSYSFKSLNLNDIDIIVCDGELPDNLKEKVVKKYIIAK